MASILTNSSSAKTKENAAPSEETSSRPPPSEGTMPNAAPSEVLEELCLPVVNETKAILPGKSVIINVNAGAVLNVTNLT